MAAWKTSGQFLTPEQAALVDERAEIGRLGDIGRGRHQPIGQLLRGLGEIEQDTAERCLGGLIVAGRCRDRRHGDGRGGGFAFRARDRAVVDERLEPRRDIVAQPAQGRPLVAFVDPEIAAQPFDLAGVHHPPSGCPCARRAAGRIP